MIAVLPRGILNNNPGNIKELPGDKTQWVGERATDDDPIFEEFKTPEDGIRALGIILLNYRQKYGLRTIEQIIHRWAPPFDKNDTSSYVRHVAVRMGLRPSDEVNVENRDILSALVESIIAHENSNYEYQKHVLTNGVDMALESRHSRIA